MNIEFTIVKKLALRKAYNKAVEDKRDQFTFEGNEYLVSYAKYLLEFLDTKLGKQS